MHYATAAMGLASWEEPGTEWEPGFQAWLSYLPFLNERPKHSPLNKSPLPYSATVNLTSAPAPRGHDSQEASAETAPVYHGAGSLKHGARRKHTDA
jgi:hypothetical protein